MTHADTSNEVHVDLGPGRKYAISFCGLERVPDVFHAAGLDADTCLVVTDENVARLHLEGVLAPLRRSGIAPRAITLPAGETTKSSRHLDHIYASALSRRIERTTPVVALGGGVIGDLAGFAAATLLRGLPLIQVPTTLVAQVDSSIGGKTGINHTAGKNLIGTFYQPRAVLADTSCLQSLPEREWTSGLAEVVKHGLIADATLVAFLEEHWDHIAARKQEVVDHVVRRAVRVKADVVGQDEREFGLRAILNFGHTFAHAIEKVSGYGTFTHGEAVAAGMRAALHLSISLTDGDARRADDLLARIPVPKDVGALDASSLIQAMQSDKKIAGGRLRFVLLDRIGRAYVTDDVDAAAIESAWHNTKDRIG